MSEEFKKDSMVNTKYKPSLIEPSFKKDLAKLLTLGGMKYGFNNWKLATKEQVVEYRDALERHLIARDKGEYLDKDTGLPHIICVAFNVMALHFFDAKFFDINLDDSIWQERLDYYKELKNGK